MAEIFRPTYTVTDPTTGERQRKRSKTWHIRYYLPDGTRDRVKGYRDRAATQRLATELERKAARKDAGIIDPTDEHARRPLVEHAKDFRRYLSAKGNTALYVDLALFRLTSILEGCKFVRIGDMQPSAVLTYLGQLRKIEGKSAAKKRGQLPNGRHA
jgi:hypothetical protein